jgi:uncharacterized protein (TIGR01619 family)
MSDDWDFFPLRVDDQPASIFVDLGIRKQAPIKSHPTMAYLRVLMLRPREDGLSSQDEFDDLIVLENKVTSKITRDGKSLFVGRNTSSGNRDFYFYTSDSTEFDVVAREAIREFPAYKYETGAREDRDWRTYFEFLHPSERSMQLIMNRRVCEQLDKNGDNLNNERKIDHLVLLPTSEAQFAFARDVTGGGFVVDSAPTEPNDEGHFSVEFSRPDRPAQIDDIVLSLFDKATELGGIYDGWGCQIAP